MSKYKTQKEWEDGIKLPMIVTIGVILLIAIIVVVIINGRDHQAELIGQQLTVDEIRRQMDDPDSYRF